MFRLFSICVPNFTTFYHTVLWAAIDSTEELGLGCCLCRENSSYQDGSLQVFEQSLYMMSSVYLSVCLQDSCQSWFGRSRWRSVSVQVTTPRMSSSGESAAPSLRNPISINYHIFPNAETYHLIFYFIFLLMCLCIVFPVKTAFIRIATTIYLYI